MTTTAEQLELFLPDANLERPAERHLYLVHALGVVGVKDTPNDDAAWPYARVNFEKGSYWHYGRQVVSSRHVSDKPATKPVRGFLSEIRYGSPGNRGLPRAHYLKVWQDVADSIWNMWADIDAISSVEIFAEGYAQTVAAYDNACMDGSSFLYQQLKGHRTDVSLTRDELEYYVTHPPKPALVIA
jgi:hypothetical protein